MKQSSLWFSDYNKTYHGEEPLFYDVSQLDIVRELEKSYPAIKDELKVVWDHSGSDNKLIFLNYSMCYFSKFFYFIVLLFIIICFLS